jgi:hypothetical protein
VSGFRITRITDTFRMPGAVLLELNKVFPPTILTFTVASNPNMFGSIPAWLILPPFASY